MEGLKELAIESEIDSNPSRTHLQALNKLLICTSSKRIERPEQAQFEHALPGIVPVSEVIN